MTTDAPSSPESFRHRRRNRIMLLGIVAVFVLPILVAKMLNLADRHPQSTRQHGELLQPPIDLSERVLKQADGRDYTWSPETRTWRMLVLAPANCGEPCTQVAGKIDTVWNLLGRHAQDVDVLWVGDPPDDASLPSTLHVMRNDPSLRAALTRQQADIAGVPVYVIDPNGFVILRFDPGFDAAGLRSDMARLLKLF